MLTGMWNIARKNARHTFTLQLHTCVSCMHVCKNKQGTLVYNVDSLILMPTSVYCYNKLLIRHSDVRFIHWLDKVVLDVLGWNWETGIQINEIWDELHSLLCYTNVSGLNPLPPVSASLDPGVVPCRTASEPV